MIILGIVVMTGMGEAKASHSDYDYDSYSYTEFCTQYWVGGDGTYFNNYTNAEYWGRFDTYFQVYRKWGPWNGWSRMEGDQGQLEGAGCRMYLNGRFAPYGYRIYHLRVSCRDCESKYMRFKIGDATSNPRNDNVACNSSFYDWDWEVSSSTYPSELFIYRDETYFTGYGHMTPGYIYIWYYRPKYYQYETTDTNDPFGGSYQTWGPVDYYISRNFTDGQWTTLCPSWNLSYAEVGSPTEVLQFSRTDNNKLVFTRVSTSSSMTFTKGNCYLIKPSTTKSLGKWVKAGYLNSTNKTPGNTTSNGVKFQGTYGRTAVSGGNYLYLRGDYDTSVGKLFGLRAYFDVSSASNAKEWEWVVEDEFGETTGIEGISADQHVRRPTDPGYIYDLNGRRVDGIRNQLNKGIYIKNGRKFVAK